MAKDKKLKVPKEVAGIKVPKKLRKTANKAIAMAENPAIRGLALAGLAAAATAIAENAEARRTAGDGARQAGKAAAKTAETVQDAAADAAAGANQLGDLIRAAALEGARRLLDNKLNGAAKPSRKSRSADAAGSAEGEQAGS